MAKEQVKWLSHLENSIPESIGGYSLSFYSIALEGWRRGLTLKFINKNRAKAHTPFELSSKSRTHQFQVSRGDMVPRKAVRTCIDKYKTKQFLLEAGVPTPKGKKFTEKNSDKKIMKNARKVGYPLVLKPLDGTGGTGVIAGIKNKKELKQAISIVREELGFKQVILEEYFKGEDYRVYVVGDEAVAVTKRVPANISGNGKSNIRELVNQNNKLRKESPILGASLIKVDSELKNMIKQKGYTLDSIPKKGELVYLKSKNNITAGGDPADITDEVSPEIKQIAVDAAKSIPGLIQAGVDLMFDTKKNKAVVIEINSRPSIRTHLFPMFGQARDIPKKIIDLYFPETVGVKKSNLLYFDFAPVWNLFQKGIAEEFTIPDLYKGDISATRYIVNKVEDYQKYSREVYKSVNKLQISGYMLPLKDDMASIIVAGESNDIKRFKNKLKSEIIGESKIVEKKRLSPVQLGFYIEQASKDQATKQKEIKSNRKDNAKVLYTPVQIKRIDLRK